MNYGYHKDFKKDSFDNIIKDDLIKLVEPDFDPFLHPEMTNPGLMDNNLCDFTPAINPIVDLDTRILSDNDYLYSGVDNKNNNTNNNNSNTNYHTLVDIPANSHEPTSTTTATTATNNNKNKKSIVSPTTSARLSDNNELTEEELYQRRKAQNRAAQRAFRERKEGKLKELSGKLQEAEIQREKLEKQLNDLKEKNLLLGMENQLLQKQQKQSSYSEDTRNSNSDFKVPFESITSSNDNDNDNDKDKDKVNVNLSNLTRSSVNNVITFKFPNTSKGEFIDGSIDWAKHGHDRNISVIEATKLGESYQVNEEKVLTVGAVWDYLVEFTKLNNDLSLDIPGIMNSLRGNEVCHGFGPAYPIKLVNVIILNHIDENE